MAADGGAPGVPATGMGFAPGDKGLKTGAISYISGIVIAVASTAPGYSLAATLGFIVAIGGSACRRLRSSSSPSSRWAASPRPTTT
ncbi:hypothetical protein [Baekduia soli]|uniref:hypothetical protein n=1 Tax=Baekduia soli TaxID=496014 RepID=UPI001651CBB8|nr:hypothetical protein [Baekduia soli]